MRYSSAFKGGLLLLAIWRSLDVFKPGWRWGRGKIQRVFQFPTFRIQSKNVFFGLNAQAPVYCSHSKHCCGVWNVSADQWWTHRPDWEVISEDDESFCFSPIQSAAKRAFMRQVHWLQWKVDTLDEKRDLSLPLPETLNFTVNCSNMVTSFNINSGFGASRPFLQTSFWYAFTQQRPFQTIEKWPWMYAFPNENSTWANCTSHDQSCLYLPVSPCSREDRGWPRFAAKPAKSNGTQIMQYGWLGEYMTRPKQSLRRELLRLRQPLEVQLKNGCVGMHVRRGDAGAPQPPYRRYAAVQEYLDIAKLPPNTTIFLLTDDESTIDEIRRYHASHYNWVYSNKIRVRGVARGFNNHVPVGSSGPEELAWITVEQELLASYCHTFVFGRSGVAHGLIELMKLNGRAVKLHYLETRVPEQEVKAFNRKPKEREAHLMKQVNARYDQ